LAGDDPKVNTNFLPFARSAIYEDKVKCHCGRTFKGWDNLVVDSIEVVYFNFGESERNSRYRAPDGGERVGVFLIIP
jgi:hypothetical protein